MDSLNVTGYGSLSQAYATSSSSSTQSSSSSNSKNTALDMSDFLKLMAAQFQNQNLDSNIDNTQYISELAQFSSIEAMTSMTQNFNKEYAASLIGKTVTVSTGSTTNPTVTGIVVASSCDSSGTSKITIGDNSYDISGVTNVYNDTSQTLAGLQMSILQYATSLVGKTVTVNTGDTSTPTVTGTVEKAVFGDNDDCKIVINGTSYDLTSIASIG